MFQPIQLMITHLYSKDKLKYQVQHQMIHNHLMNLILLQIYYLLLIFQQTTHQKNQIQKQKLLKKKYVKIGILGGTFDPPHKGHLYISKIVLNKLKLNKLLWIVTKENPLKQKHYLNIKKRIALSKNITKKENKMTLSLFFLFLL